MIDDKFVLMPTVEQTKESTLDLVVAGSKESVLMIEGFADQLPEEQMGDAIMFAHKAIAELCALQEELATKVGAEKVAHPEPEPNPFFDEIDKEFYEKFRDAKTDPSKADRRERQAAVKEEIYAKYFPEEGMDGRRSNSIAARCRDLQADCQGCSPVDSRRQANRWSCSRRSAWRGLRCQPAATCSRFCSVHSW